jgi:hypothetical protein
MVSHQVRPTAGLRLLAVLVAASGLQIATGIPSHAQDKPGRYMMNPFDLQTTIRCGHLGMYRNR